MGWFSNKYLVGATLIVMALQVAALYTPIMQKVLRTVPLTLSEWLMIILVASSILVVEEVRKLFYRGRFHLKNT